MSGNQQDKDDDRQPPSRPSESEKPEHPVSLFTELRRRKVFRAAGAYLVVAWIILQAAAILLPTFDVPAWGMRLIVLMCAFGFPLVVLLAWAFELSPDGMRRTIPVQAEEEAAADPRQNSRRNRAAFALGIAVPSAGFLVLLLILLLRPGGEPSQSGHDRSIAVLPFANLSANEDNAYFAGGMHEDLLTQLARLDDLEVASKTSVLRYKEHPDNLRTVAEHLGVRYIVEGSVQRVGEDVRITVQLIDASTDKHLWAEKFDRRLENIFALQSEISREIAQRVQARISPEEDRLLNTVPTTVVAAYDAYLKARSRIVGFWVGFDVLAEAEKELTFATRADPAFIEAWALLANVHSRRYMQLSNLDQSDPKLPEEARKAATALRQAKDLNPGHVATLRAEGFYEFIVTNDFLAGSRSLDRAIQLVPNDTESLTTLAYCYRRLGQIDKAITLLEDLYQKSPDEPFVLSFLTACLHDTAQYARLVPIFTEALERHPERKHYALDSLYYEFLATGDLATFHRYERALSELEITAGCNPSAWRHGRMTVAMLSGEFDAYADNWRIEWEEHHRDHGDWVCPLQVNEEANHAALLFAQGRSEEAMEIIEQSFGNIELPPNPLASCTFDPEMIRPKLYYMTDNPEKALEDLQYALRKLAEKPDSLLKYVEKGVLLEAADLIAPELAYSIYKDIANDPIRKASLEIICANPWTYPHLLEDPEFRKDVLADGRFVEFLRHYGFLASVLD